MKRAAFSKRRLRHSQKDQTSMPRIIVNQWLSANPKAVHRFLLKFYSQTPLLVLALLFLTAQNAIAESKPLVSSVPEPSKLVSKEGEHKSRAPEVKEKKKFNVILPSADPKEIKAEGKNYSLLGEVTGRNSYGLAVMYEVDAVKGSSKEMWFNLMKETKLNGIKSLSELQEGDKVNVIYKELKETKKKLMISVTLTQKKPKEAPVKEPAADSKEAAEQ